MNAHSLEGGVVLGCKVFRKAETGEVYARRRADILAAAERCFVQSGFHRTSIQTIAADAGMSVGNVYRYFPAKDAVVEALVGRDQAQMAQDFNALAADDLLGSFAALMRRQIVECGRARSVLWLEICAEAARNPAIAAVTRAHEQAILGHLTTFFARVIADRARHGTASGADPGALATLVVTVFGGLMIKQALTTDAATGPVIDQLQATIAAAIEGRVALGETPPTRVRIDA